MRISTIALPATLVTSVLGLPHVPWFNADEKRVLPLIKRDYNNTGNSTLVPNHFTWKAPTKEDSRAPCPMLNTLANHGFLPHDGRNVTYEILSNGISSALRIEQSAIDIMFNAAVNVSPVENATSFDLGMLHVRPFIEHDGSTGFQDVYFDIRNVFHEPTFNNFMSYIEDESEMSITATANAKARHMYDMSKINPRFTLLKSQLNPIYLELSSMFTMWAQPDFRAMKREWFEYFFRNARLPVELGWAPPAQDIPFDYLLREVISPELLANLPAGVPVFYNPGDPDQ